MSSSWTRESRVSGPPRHRGQASPVAALVALFAVCAGLSLYATVLGGSIPVVAEQTVAAPTLDRAVDDVSDGGVVSLDRLASADAGRYAPDGRSVNVSLTFDTASGHDYDWAVGPRAPARATDRASRPVSVRLGPGRVDAGRLAVVVWS
ncbi:DUF7285 family protein [Halogeometricum limi]|uniref:Uncharacterized protein n=1 Tax=Halogeometricum limi TaxID=555875 RepID=A0A1I6G6A3_9EURY|nr:hypothetical protein [Halogeometricum limi]SFR37728.1 hypothetical protein SAMN04488124_0936 [Halogeometricum limi]